MVSVAGGLCPAFAGTTGSSTKTSATARARSAPHLGDARPPNRVPLCLSTGPLPEDAEDVAASEAVVGVVFDVLRGYDVADDVLVDATRTLRAGLHGFVALEAAGGYAMARPVGDSLAWWLDSLDRALASAG